MAVINPRLRLRMRAGTRFSGVYRAGLAPLILLAISSSPNAAVLPEDRADLLYHSYEGGGAEISGPSLLVRKKFGENVSASYNHYVDSVSSASIDVITTASEYSEERTEDSISVDYLRDKTLMTFGLTRSSESDYEADTLNMNISQDMFGDLTTVSMGYAQGDNDIGRNGDPDFSNDPDSQSETRSYRLGLSQVISKDLIMSFALESITDQGYLNNPYRSVRYIEDSVALGYAYQPEKYPNTRTSHAFAVRGKYYLEHRAALHVGYRLFADTWGIEADTYELGYVWPYNDEWLFEFSYRYYEQSKADFYSDLFPFGGLTNPAQNFLARDKELSTFSDQTIGAGATYEFERNGSGFIKRGSVNFYLDLLQFEYEDFRDLTVTTTNPGEEPLYEFDATVIRLFVSIWF